MHLSSINKMTAFRRRYLNSQATKPLVMFDLGRQDIRGSYRSIFDRPPWQYVGVDIVPGKNVDVFVRDAYRCRELKANSVDVLISGQTFEHTEFFWETAEEIARILKPNGLCCVIASWTGPVHRYPLDCWRMNCDGMLAIARYAGLEVLEAWRAAFFLNRSGFRCGRAIAFRRSSSRRSKRSVANITADRSP